MDHYQWWHADRFYFRLDPTIRAIISESRIVILSDVYVTALKYVLQQFYGFELLQNVSV